MHQILSYVILTATLFVNLTLMFTIITNQSIHSIENIELVSEQNEWTTTGSFKFDSYSYTQNPVDNTSHSVDLKFKHDGSRKIYPILDFDVFSSLSLLSSNKSNLHDIWLPYGGTADIIASGSFWKYQLISNTLNPNIWDPGEFMNITISIYNDTGFAITGNFTVGIYIDSGWGYEMVIEI